MVEWNGTVISTTPRLILRTFREDDLPLYAALNAHPEVVRWLGGEPLTREHSDSIAEWAQELYAEEGIGLLAVERRSDGAFLGMCGLHHLASFPDDVEIGWRFAYEYWGTGLRDRGGDGVARARVRAARARSCDLDHRYGERTEPGVMRRLGMTFEREAQMEDEGMLFDAVVYEISAERWRLR